jgi:small redox-active disulfide protein 2
VTADIHSDPCDPEDIMDIKVLGPGCRNCVLLEQRTREALDALGIDAEVEKVTDPVAIVAYGAMSTPGLVVDDRLVLTGKVPTARKLAQLLDG